MFLSRQRKYSCVNTRPLSQTFRCILHNLEIILCFILLERPSLNVSFGKILTFHILRDKDRTMFIVLGQANSVSGCMVSESINHEVPSD